MGSLGGFLALMVQLLSHPEEADLLLRDTPDKVRLGLAAHFLARMQPRRSLSCSTGGAARQAGMTMLLRRK